MLAQNINEQPQNIEGLFCYFDENQIVLEKRIHSYAKEPEGYLVINRKTEQIIVSREVDVSKLTKRVFSAFLGIVKIGNYKFVVLCDEAKICSSVDNILIFQISSLFFLCYTSDRELSIQPERKEAYQQIRDLYEILKSGFYFSYRYNLTQSFQFQDMGTKNRFIWNLRFFTELQKNKIEKQWMMPIIQGYVSNFQVFIQGTKVSYILISRRSNKKAGTRYFDRGTDQNGYVANFVYTEQIIKIDDFYVSDIQVRGSLPLFFQQKGLRTLIKLTRGYQLTHQVYVKHFQKLKDHFSRVFFVNLLSKGKKGEVTLIQQIERHVKSQNDPDIKYMYYDFHTQVSGGKYQNVDHAINKVRQIKNNLKCYIYDAKNQKVLERPYGVFRTNCLDCLDRTNFFQAKLALITLEQIFNHFNLEVGDLLQSMNNNEQDNQLIKKFRHIWANNGDNISFHYTGTGSTHTDITRDGKRGLTGVFKHKYKSVARFYNQNFWDFYKMKLVDLLLGQNVSELQNIRLPTIVKQRQIQFKQTTLLNIKIFSWKTPKKVPASLPLFSNEHQIIAISLQQVGQAQKWNKLINQAISQHYMLVGQKYSNNNLLKIYALKQLKSNISNVQMTKVKFKSYFNQYISTKCAIIIRFYFNNTRITFCGCQLQYGRQFVVNRIRNLKDIHQFAFQQVKVGQKKLDQINSDDAIFMFGNMNVHCSPHFKEEIAKINPKKPLSLQQRRLIKSFLDTDEFNQIRQILIQYRQYEEEEIKFPPTYKYVSDAFQIDKSGWPDRIWYSTNNKMICSNYSTVQELRDEHVPVVGEFHLQTVKIDEEKKAQVMQQALLKISSKQQVADLLQHIQNLDTKEEDQKQQPTIKL